MLILNSCLCACNESGKLVTAVLVELCVTFELLHFYFYLTLSVILMCHIQNLLSNYGQQHGWMSCNALRTGMTATYRPSY